MKSIPSPNFQNPRGGFCPKRTRRGFTFVEVLFAVILLGIGFIMIAGVFPVSIQQSAITIDETTGATIARGAIDQIQDAINSGMPMPVTVTSAGVLQFWPLQGTQWAYLGSNSFFYPGQASGATPNRFSASINTQDPRYGWAAFYCRSTTNGSATGTPYPYAQIIVVALKNPNFASYAYPPPVPPVLYPSPNTLLTAASLNVMPPTATDTAKFTLDNSGNTQVAFTSNPLNIATGAFVILQQAPTGNASWPSAGRIYRLGALEPGQINEYQLQPGTDPQTNEAPNSASGSGSFNTTVYVIGRAPTLNPSGTSPTDFSGSISQYTGPVQDIAAVSGIVRVNQ